MSGADPWELQASPPKKIEAKAADLKKTDAQKAEGRKAETSVARMKEADAKRCAGQKGEAEKKAKAADDSDRQATSGMPIKEAAKKHARTRDKADASNVSAMQPPKPAIEGSLCLLIRGLDNGLLESSEALALSCCCISSLLFDRLALILQAFVGVFSDSQGVQGTSGLCDSLAAPSLIGSFSMHLPMTLQLPQVPSPQKQGSLRWTTLPSLLSQQKEKRARRPRERHWKKVRPVLE